MHNCAVDSETARQQQSAVASGNGFVFFTGHTLSLHTLSQSHWLFSELQSASALTWKFKELKEEKYFTNLFLISLPHQLRCYFRAKTTVRMEKRGEVINMWIFPWLTARLIFQMPLAGQISGAIQKHENRISRHAEAVQSV